ncbi:MAG: hypothetical protein ACI87O_003230, partial [Planctomycetota bacterium]
VHGFFSIAGEDGANSKPKFRDTFSKYR